MTFERDGAQLFPAAAVSVLGEIEAALAHVSAGRAGLRLSGQTALQPILEAAGPVGAVAASRLGRDARPVRAILFDKNPEVNWGLGWHQDRVICVRNRVETEGFGPWTIKDGLLHVAPPVALLAAMVTLRLHLDDVPVTNAPLLVAPGSHRGGRVPEIEIDRVVEGCGIRACTAGRGDIWLYATLILHASEPAKLPGRRRVLQIDYAAQDLPGELEWLGV